MNFKKILLITASVFLPGGLLAAAGYFLVRKLKKVKDAIPSEAKVGDDAKNENQVN
jgi:hypothetical protein